jgi:hypothetical protein
LAWKIRFIIAPATTKVSENILILLFKFKNTDLLETGIYLENRNENYFNFAFATSLTSNDYDIKGGGVGALLNLDANALVRFEPLFS